MKAIILSAGQGRRLGKLTEKAPKCLLKLAGRPLIEWQLEEIEHAGIQEVVVVTGFGHEQVEEEIRSPKYRGLSIRSLYNPQFATADNLISCWFAREEMNDDFFLVNGDSLFESEVIDRLDASTKGPICLAVATKPLYDDDDMKVSCSNGLVRQVSKKIPREEVNGEAIGVSFFRGDGPSLMRETLEAFAARTDGSRLWYLSAVNDLASRGMVGAVAIDGCGWAEVDFPGDIDIAEHILSGRIEPDLHEAMSPPKRVSRSVYS